VKQRYIGIGNRTLQVSITHQNWTFGVWWLKARRGLWVGIDLGPLELVVR
jgi:hypothetical protein